MDWSPPDSDGVCTLRLDDPLRAAGSPAEPLASAVAASVPAPASSWITIR